MGGDYLQPGKCLMEVHLSAARTWAPVAHGTEKQLPHRAPDVMGLESLGSVGHTKVEGAGEIHGPCSELGLRAGSLRVAKPGGHKQ